MTVVSIVEKVNELEKEIAASSSIDKEVIALHVRRLMSATGLTTVPSMYVMGEDLLFHDDLFYDDLNCFTTICWSKMFRSDQRHKSAGKTGV